MWIKLGSLWHFVQLNIFRNATSSMASISSIRSVSFVNMSESGIRQGIKCTMDDYRHFIWCSFVWVLFPTSASHVPYKTETRRLILSSSLGLNGNARASQRSIHADVIFLQEYLFMWRENRPRKSSANGKQIHATATMTSSLTMEKSKDTNMQHTQNAKQKRAPDRQRFKSRLNVFSTSFHFGVSLCVCASVQALHLCFARKVLAKCVRAHCSHR